MQISELQRDCFHASFFWSWSVLHGSLLCRLSRSSCEVYVTTALEGCNFKGAMAITRQGDGSSKIKIGSAQPLLKDNQPCVSFSSTPRATEHCSRGPRLSRSRGFRLCLSGRKAISPTSDSLVRPFFLLCADSFSCFFSLIFIPQWNIWNRKGKMQ